MSGSSFGKLFKITTWGESHGRGLGVVIEIRKGRFNRGQQPVFKKLDFPVPLALLFRQPTL